MSAEVAAGRRRELLDRHPALEVENDCESTRTAGKGHRRPPVRGNGNAVATAGKPNNSIREKFATTSAKLEPVAERVPSLGSSQSPDMDATSRALSAERAA
ncbi:MAG: hypothetical protein OXC01_20505 [Immundisolibacterales bacterium]|nr:hypothetical protein [Immundisolibacterales bacterium]